MKAQRSKVTVLTVEVTEGDDFTIKTKIKEELLEGTKMLMDSTVENYAIEHHNWLNQAKKTARNNARNGVINSENHTYWVAIEESDEEKPVKGALFDEDLTPPANTEDGDDGGDEDIKEIKNSELTLPELRVKYPDIKTTSRYDFLNKIKEQEEKQ